MPTIENSDHQQQQQIKSLPASRNNTIHSSLNTTTTYSTSVISPTFLPFLVPSDMTTREMYVLQVRMDASLPSNGSATIPERRTGHQV